MIDEAKISEVMANLSIQDGDTAFAGAMPVGECKLVSIAKEPKTLNGSNWYPVTFSTANGPYELSLKGLLQAEGLQYKSRDLKERIKAWYALEDTGATSSARKFDFLGKKERSFTYRKDTTDFNNEFHAKGSTGTMKINSFKTKTVG